MYWGNWGIGVYWGKSPCTNSIEPDEAVGEVWFGVLGYWGLLGEVPLY